MRCNRKTCNSVCQAWDCFLSVRAAEIRSSGANAVCTMPECQAKICPSSARSCKAGPVVACQRAWPFSSSACPNRSANHAAGSTAFNTVMKASSLQENKGTPGLTGLVHVLTGLRKHVAAGGMQHRPYLLLEWALKKRCNLHRLL